MCAWENKGQQEAGVRQDGGGSCVWWGHAGAPGCVPGGSCSSVCQVCPLCEPQRAGGWSVHMHTRAKVGAWCPYVCVCVCRGWRERGMCRERVQKRGVNG